MTNVKTNIAIGYFSIGILYTFYSYFFGKGEYESFAYNIGQGIVWPASMFPVLGQILGGIIILAFIGFVVLKK